MAKNYLQTLIRLNQNKENTVSQNYLDILLKTYTRKNHLREGEGRQGVLTMVEANEKFEFVEQVSERWARNPKVFQGEYINVHRDKNGHYFVHLRKLELNGLLNVIRVGNAIITELLTAKKLLRVCKK